MPNSLVVYQIRYLLYRYSVQYSKTAARCLSSLFAWPTTHLHSLWHILYLSLHILFRIRLARSEEVPSVCKCVSVCVRVCVAPPELPLIVVSSFTNTYRELKVREKDLAPTNKVYLMPTHQTKRDEWNQHIERKKEKTNRSMCSY